MGLVFLLILPAITLAALVCLPNGWVNPRAAGFRQVVTRIAGLQFAVATCYAVAQAIGWLPVIHVVLARFAAELPIAVTIHYDGVASLMLMLVSFVGWVICQYSIRYLDGEATQGRYFRWTAFTIGAVSLMVISGNLLMFLAAWIMTSLGLHQLLMHYGHRPAAKRAAWTKFVISRFGDAALLAVVVILYSQFQTLDFPELFAAAGSLERVPAAMHWVGFLLVIGAVLKSAQFPFHTWLPQTMETPTPVSALMHAGIVNAGGYLIIRTSPLVSLTPWALTTLAIVGGVTACYGAVVMLTQTSVKKSLAYSTVAQMGFMMLQCGLGAYSAAMLHILAHSLYKAHAFLSSGSVIAELAKTNPPAATAPPVAGTMHCLANTVASKKGSGPNGAKHPLGRSGYWGQTPFSVPSLVIAGTMIVALLGTALAVVGVDPMTKPGGWLLGGILSLALTHWVGLVMRKASPAMLVRAMLIAGGLCWIYAVSFLMVDQIIMASLPVSVSPELYWFVAAVVAMGFGGMFALHSALSVGVQSPTFRRWRIHASNGFYVENSLRRIFGPLVNT